MLFCYEIAERSVRARTANRILSEMVKKNHKFIFLVYFIAVGTSFFPMYIFVHLL